MSTSILPASSDGHKLPRMVGAVIYIRVSTKEQTENLSLSTQLKACDEYCQRQGFEVLARFREEGESAKSADRTELQKMLHYCRLHKGRVQFVVVFNLTRFAREKYDHFVLRAHLKSLGISLRSATEPIDDTSTGKLMEGVLAAFAQFDNDVRSERTRGGMRAALELGRWTFLAPLGYLNAPRAMGNSLIPDPERASLVRRAFQDFATGRFTKHEVRKAVNDLGLKTRRGQPVPSQTFDAMLRNRVYIAQIEVPDYGVSTRGDFEPLVSEKVFFRVQAILDGRLEITAPRQRNDPGFPLRGYVRCETCGKPLTASWSKGRSDYYAYYHCRGRCRAANISKAKLEDISNDVGEVKRHVVRSGRRSRLSKARVGGGGRVSGGQRFPMSTPQRSKLSSSITDGVAHQTSLRSPRDHDDSCELPSTGGGSPIHFAGHDPRTTSPHRHPRIQASPRRRSFRSATAELLVIDLIAQENPQADAELPRDGHPRFAEPLLRQFPAVESSQRRITPHRVNGRLAPQIAQERIPLLGELSESLPIAARVFAGNQPDVTGQGLRVGKP
jgi:DNA invertase Pin-like site-specific DNA recombinase